MKKAPYENIILISSLILLLFDGCVSQTQTTTSIISTTQVTASSTMEISTTTTSIITTTSIATTTTTTVSPPITTPPFCVDLDNGDPYIKGSAKSYGWGYKLENNQTDYCINNTAVREYGCTSFSGGSVTSEDITCINGCIDGACIENNTAFE